MYQTINALKHISQVWQSFPKFSENALMDMHEKTLLFVIAQNLPENAIMVEIGTFVGASATLLASANPTATIYTIDSYSKLMTGSSHTSPVQEKIFGKNQLRTFEKVKEILSEYKNVIHINANSPVDLINTWDEHNIDFYFEDGDHHDPGFTNNVDFWLPKIKIGGYVAFHDSRPWVPKENTLLNFPAIDNKVDNMFKNPNWEFICRASSLIAFKRIS